MGCPAEVKGRRKRCDDCRRSRRADLERTRYHDNADEINTKRSLRRQGAAEYEAPTDEVIDYSGGGDELPGMRPVSEYRPHISHDRAAYVAQKRAEELGDDEPSTMSSWSDLQARQEPDNSKVYFPPAPGSPALPGGPSNLFRGREVPQGPPDFPAVAGQAVVRRSEPSGPHRGTQVTWR
jgi:hypothetical protein